MNILSAKYQRKGVINITISIMIKKKNKLKTKDILKR